jgi:hypothetical protein
MITYTSFFKPSPKVGIGKTNSESISFSWLARNLDDLNDIIQQLDEKGFGKEHLKKVDALNKILFYMIHDFYVEEPKIRNAALRSALTLTKDALSDTLREIPNHELSLKERTSKIQHELSRKLSLPGSELKFSSSSIERFKETQEFKILQNLLPFICNNFRFPENFQETVLWLAQQMQAFDCEKEDESNSVTHNESQANLVQTLEKITAYFRDLNPKIAHEFANTASRIQRLNFGMMRDPALIANQTDKTETEAEDNSTKDEETSQYHLHLYK